MVERLKDTDFSRDAKDEKKLNSYAKQQLREEKLTSITKEFMQARADSFDEQLATIPSAILEALLELFLKFANEKGKMTTGGGTSTTKADPVKLLEALKLATKANSLDEFLSLLKLSRFKEGILAMGFGTTLEAIAAKVVADDLNADTFMKEISTLGRSQANRCVKYMKRNHLARKKRRNEKEAQSKESLPSEKV